MKIVTKSLLTLCFGALCVWRRLVLRKLPRRRPRRRKGITDADVAGAPVPSADARSKGDPDGSLTAQQATSPVTDTKKGATIVTW